MTIPRGGVPLGYIIAQHYSFPMELLLTKKIGHPENKEFAIGAVSLESVLIDDNYGIPETYLAEEIKRIKQSLQERYKKFAGNRSPIDLKNKIIIIVDDGIATGNTIIASIKMLREKHPQKIVVAVPVAPPETARKIKKLVDEFICPNIPNYFSGVGQFYVDFSEVTDEDVIDLLKKATNFKGAL